MNQKEILSKCDHTLLKTTATWQDIQKIVDDGIEYGCASVCIPSSYVKQAAEYAKGQIPICTVIGFPNGYDTTLVKVAAAREAVENGAAEVDMVINLGWVKDGQYDRVLDEIKAIRQAIPDQILKVIIETSDLTDDEKVRMCEVVNDSGADFIKTSTGFSTGGATFEDVALLRKHSANHVKVKASGGIHSMEDAQKLIELGADRLGTSRLVKIAASQKI
ncbi:deoxyribose-phosphate aldolase [Erysipelotrichaceae bacterium RD49]|nr:deoxyribose-phosphate aldolase [Erysipelotrichaceae bacterium RD49]